MLLIVAVTALVAGLLIGLTGIGGVLMVPVLTQGAGVSLERAIAASLVGFLVAGTYAAIVHLRRERLPTRPVVVLCVCAAAGSVAGAVSLDSLPPAAIRILIAVLCFGSGLHALFSTPASRSTTPSTTVLGVLGVAVGCVSSLSGTGGPVTLIPLLLALGTPVGIAVTLGLAAQVPIALSATAIYALQDRIDVALAATLSVLLFIGVLVGTKLSARLSGRGLTRAVASTLVVVGIGYGYGTLMR